MPALKKKMGKPRIRDGSLGPESLNYGDLSVLGHKLLDILMSTAVKGKQTVAHRAVVRLEWHA